MKNILLLILLGCSILLNGQKLTENVDPALISFFDGEEFQKAECVRVLKFNSNLDDRDDIIDLISEHKQFNVLVGDFSYVHGLAIDFIQVTQDSSLIDITSNSGFYDQINFPKKDIKVVGFGRTNNYNIPLYILQHYYNGKLNNNVHFSALKNITWDRTYSDPSYSDFDNEGDLFEDVESEDRTIKAALLREIISQLLDSTQYLDQYFGGTEIVKKIIEFPYHFPEHGNDLYKEGRIDWIVDKEDLTKKGVKYLFTGWSGNSIFFNNMDSSSMSNINIAFGRPKMSAIYPTSDRRVRKYKSEFSLDYISFLNDGITSKELRINSQYSEIEESFSDYKEDIQYQFISENFKMDISGIEQILGSSDLNFHSGGFNTSGSVDFTVVFGGGYRYGFANGEVFGNDYKLRMNQYSMFIGYNLLNSEYLLIKPEINIGWSTKRLKYTNSLDSINLGQDYSFPVTYSFDSWSIFTKPMLNVEFGYKALILGGRIGYSYDFYGSKWNKGLGLRSNVSVLVYDFHLAFRIMT